MILRTLYDVNRAVFCMHGCGVNFKDNLVKGLHGLVLLFVGLYEGLSIGELSYVLNTTEKNIRDSVKILVSRQLVIYDQDLVIAHRAPIGGYYHKGIVKLSRKSEIAWDNTILQTKQIELQIIASLLQNLKYHLDNFKIDGVDPYNMFFELTNIVHYAVCGFGVEKTLTTELFEKLGYIKLSKDIMFPMFMHHAIRLNKKAFLRETKEKDFAIQPVPQYNNTFATNPFRNGRVQTSSKSKKIIQVS